MITSSTNTKDFKSVEADPQFRVDSPHTNPFLAAAALNVTQGFDGPDITIAYPEIGDETPSIEVNLDEVIGNCKRETELYPKSARTHTNLAIAYLRRAKYQEALQSLGLALSLDEKDYIALHTLALTKINIGALEDASNIYKEINKAYPDDLAALISSANIEIRHGNFAQAAALLFEAVKVDKYSASAKYQLAMVLLKLGKAHQSIGLLRKAVVEDNRSADLYQALAVAYLVAGDFKRAERAFKSALALNGSMSPALHGLAQLKLQQGQLEDAIGLLTDHLIQADDDTARELLSNAYVRNEQYARARLQLVHLFSKYQRDKSATSVELARVSNNIGNCFIWENLPSEAEQWLKRSLEFDRTSSVVPYNNLAQIHLGQGRPKAALQVLERARFHFPSNIRCRVLTEAALIRVGRVDDAIAELQGLLNSDTPPVEAYIDLGWVLVDLRDDNENALAVLRSGFERYPENPFLANNLAYAYLMRSEPQYARSILDSLPTDNDHVHLIATRGLLRLWEGAFEDAETLYKQAERLASQMGASDLARLVRQKKHLEFARAYLRLGQREDAMQSIATGLTVPRSREPYKYQKDLEALRNSLTTGNDQNGG